MEVKWSENEIFGLKRKLEIEKKKVKKKKKERKEKKRTHSKSFILSSKITLV